MTQDVCLFCELCALLHWFCSCIPIDIYSTSSSAMIQLASKVLFSGAPWELCEGATHTRRSEFCFALFSRCIMTSSCAPGCRYLSYNFGAVLELEGIIWNRKPRFGAVQLYTWLKFLTLFPGLPTVQFFITCSMQKRRGIYCKRSRTGRWEGLEARCLV